MDDLRSAEVDFLTIGQYLQPSRKHHPVARYVPPDEFKAYETIAFAKGFLMVSASPLTRSSHHAGEDFARLRAASRGSQAQRLLLSVYSVFQLELSRNLLFWRGTMMEEVYRKLIDRPAPSLSTRPKAPVPSPASGARCSLL
jgi:hypothetical protein